MGTLGSAVETTSSCSLILLTRGVANGLIHREDGAGSLGGCGENINSDNLGLPDESGHQVGNLSIEHVNTLPDTFFGSRVNLTELVNDIGGVHAGVVSELLRDDFESLGVPVNHELRLSLDGTDMFAEVSAELHFDGTTTGDDGVGLNCAGNNHDGVVEGASGFLDVLGGTTTDDHGDGLGGNTLGEHVVSLVTELDFLELSTLAHDSFAKTVGGSLNLSTGSLGNALQIVRGDATSAEDISISEVLGGEVTNGELGEDDLSA